MSTQRAMAKTPRGCHTDAPHIPETLSYHNKQTGLKFIPRLETFFLLKLDSYIMLFVTVIIASFQKTIHCV